MFSCAQSWGLFPVLLDLPFCLQLVMLSRMPGASHAHMLAHAHLPHAWMLHDRAVSLPCLLLQGAGCAFEDASVRHIGAPRHPWPEPITRPHLLGIVLAREALALPGAPAAPAWCPQPAPASVAAQTPGRAEAARDDAPGDPALGAFAQRFAAHVTRTPGAPLAPAEAEAWARRVVAAMRTALLRPGSHTAAEESGQTPAGCAAAGRSSVRQHASGPGASGARGELLQAPVAHLESGQRESLPVPLAPGGQTAARRARRQQGALLRGVQASRSMPVSPRPAARGATCWRPWQAWSLGVRWEAPRHEPASLSHAPAARRSARIAARSARQASREREVSMHTVGDAPAPKRVCTEARRAAACAQAGAAMQTAGCESAHTDGDDLRRPGMQEPASSMAGDGVAAALPAGPGQGNRVLAALAAPIAAAAAAGVARPAANLGWSRAAGYAALHSQGAAQGRPGGLGSPVQRASDAEGRGGAPRSRQAPTEESAWDRMRTWWLAARQAMFLPADTGVSELASADSL